MGLFFFAIPTLESNAAQAELNAFCCLHRVVAIDRQLVTAGVQSHWAICVTVADGPGPLPANLTSRAHRGGGHESGSASRVDYKEMLSAEAFVRFAALRAWRKTVALQEGVPVYAVFTNEQLAEIAKREVSSLAALGSIDGVGGARLERYGAAVLALLAAAPPVVPLPAAPVPPPTVQG